MMNASAPTELARPDATVADAAARAMRDLGARWADAAARLDDDAAAALRVELRDRIAALGFADVLDGPDDRAAWPDCAAVLRAAAAAAVPLDMALWVVSRDPSLASAHDPQTWRGETAEAGLGGDHATALALARALQINGALHAALDLAIGYVRERKQFGRPLAAFQAIQHMLAVAAEHTAAAGAATDLALAAVCRDGIASPRTGALLDAAALVVDEAVDAVYDAAHQVHGAIGFTREYLLHRHTVAVQAWRDSLMRLRGHGAALRLGERVAGRGQLWGEITALMSPAAPR